MRAVKPLSIPHGDFGGYIFDCDGALADTMPLHHRAWTRLVAEYGGSFDEETFYRLGGRPTARILEQLRDQQGLEISDVAAAVVRKEHYFLELMHEVRPIEPVIEFARRWHSVRPLAVASGGMRRYVEMTLDAIGIKGLFDALVCVEDCSRGKPNPDPFLEAARRLGVPAGECLVFEDSPLGIQAAEAAGMQWVLVPRYAGSGTAFGSTP